MASRRGHGAHAFETSNEDKVLFPGAGITKGDLIDYYERVAPVMLPHVGGRLVAMRRYPNGIEGKHFYQKNVPGYFPDWIGTVQVRKKGGRLRHWRELGDAELHARTYTLENLFRRLAHKADPWKGISRHAAALPGALAARQRAAAG